MKKLLLLCLVLLGGVMQMSATNLSRRIFIEIQGDLATSWSWKNQNPVVWIGSNANAVTTQLQMDTYDRDNKKNKLYYADITGEDLSNLTLIITSGENINDQWHAVTVNNVDLTEINKIFYIYIDNNACSAVSADYTYKFIHWVENGDHITTDLTYNGNNLIGTYTNSGTNFGLVFPSLVTSGQPFANFYWAFAHRPANTGSDFIIDQFQVYSDNLTGSDKTFKFTADMDYSLSFTISSTPTFTITPYFTRTLPDAAQGYATFSSTYDVIPDANLTAVQYASAVNSSTGHITWESFPATGIKAGEGALLTGTAGNTYRFTPATNAVAISGNCLKAIDNKQKIDQISDGKTNYILTLVGTDVGFYKVNENGSWCSAGTAYLAVPGVSLARDFFALDGETTGIANVEINANDNFDANAPMYNLAGQRVGKNYKGVVIVNGKKMILK